MNPSNTPPTSDLTAEVVVKKNDAPYIRAGLITVVVTFVLLLGWSALAPLQSAVVANGRITVATHNKTIQHLDGGLVKDIAVADGDIVEAGQLLVRLDATPIEIQLDNVSEQLLELSSNRERLAAERDDEPTLVFSDELEQRARSDADKAILETQKALFQARRDAMESERKVLQQRIEQSVNQIDGLGKQISALQQRTRLLDEDLAGLNKLAARGMVSKTQVRQAQRKRSELRGDVAALEGEKARLSENIIETRQQIILRKREYQKEVMTRLRDLQVRIIDLRSAERTARDKISRIEIRAPVRGKIKGFDIVTLGAVINAGQSIMEIVPLGQTFKIVARVSPVDVDALYPGLQAEVRLPVFDDRNFPAIYAELQDVSADIYAGESVDAPYYKATLVVGADGMAVLAKKQASLVSGMPVDVYIRTGERTFLDYLTRPFQNMLARALNEA
jgi:epimerase transport system membrane fusion protein